MEDYKVELLDPSRFEQLIPLMQDSFGISVDLEYFKWKFLDNPAGSFVGFVAISATGEFAAYYGVIPEWYQFGKEQRIIYQSCDTMTHSKHRRRGLFQTLAIACYEYLRNEKKLFVIGFGGGQSTPGFLKFGWKKIFDIHYLFRPYVLSTLSRFNPVRRSGNFFVKDFDGQYEELVRIILQNGQPAITQVRTKEFLSWRLSNPRKKYVINYIFSEASGQLVGYFIYYLEENKIILFDLCTTDSSSVAAVRNFLDEMSVRIKCKGIITISQLETSFSSQLLRNGFWINRFNKGPLSEKIPFIFYASNEELNQYQSENQWNIIPFCHDSF